MCECVLASHLRERESGAKIERLYRGVGVCAVLAIIQKRACVCEYLREFILRTIATLTNYGVKLFSCERDDIECDYERISCASANVVRVWHKFGLRGVCVSVVRVCPKTESVFSIIAHLRVKSASRGFWIVTNKKTTSKKECV